MNYNAFEKFVKKLNNRAKEEFDGYQIKVQSHKNAQILMKINSWILHMVGKMGWNGIQS